MQWLFDSKKRFGLCVLDYVVASNHIHLLVKDSDEDVIAPSMQLIAGRTAQQYNRRKQRKGAFWEDRYHATAIETDARLQRCLVYIDLNMVRAGGVQHPSEWQHGGYCEIQRPHARYAVIDLGSLSTLCGFLDVGQFQQAHQQWVARALAHAAPRELPAPLLSPPTRADPAATIPQIGILPLGDPRFEEASRQGLRERGYISSKNILFEWRRYPCLMENEANGNLVRLAIDLAPTSPTPQSRTIRYF